MKCIIWSLSDRKTNCTCCSDCFGDDTGYSLQSGGHKVQLQNKPTSIKLCAHSCLEGATETQLNKMEIFIKKQHNSGVQSSANIFIYYIILH